MELLERYLQAIGLYLPEQTRTDTLAELRANLLEEIDAQADTMERPLTDAEVAAILKEHGKPAVVAARYLPQRSLIGPAVFPVYALTLRKALPLVVLVSALAEGFEFVSSSHAALAQALLATAGGVVWSMLLSMAIITAVFAGIEYAVREGKAGFSWETFDPFKLPEVRKPEQPAAKSFGKRVAGLVVHCVWMGWVLSLPWKPVWHIGSGSVGIVLVPGWAFAPVWHTFYGLVVVILGLQLIAKIVALRHDQPRWLDLVTDPLGIVALAWLAHANEFFVAAGPLTNLNDIADANRGVGVAVRIVLLLAIFGLVKKIWKRFKQRPGIAILAF